MKKFIAKLHIKSHWLILIASLYFAFVLNCSFWRYVLLNIEITNFSVALFAFSLLFFIFVPVYIAFNLLCQPYITKPVLITLLLISAGTNYLMFKYGVYIDADMIRNTFETNMREASDFLTWPSALCFFFTGLVPAVLLALTKITYAPFWTEVKRRTIYSLAALFSLGVLGGASYKEYAAFGRNHRDTRRLINTGNYLYATMRYFQIKARSKRVFETLDTEAKHMPYEDAALTVLIFVLGETARAKNFSLYGYERDTNPLLAKEDIAVFKDVTSCGTATAVSVPCIFSNINRPEFNADDAKFVENLADLAHNTGYEVLWLENDDGCKGVCSRITTENMVEINNPKYCDGTYCKDEVLTYNLEERLSKITKDTFIILHTMGSHGPTYYKRYPDAFKKFTPTCDSADIQNCSLDAIKNTYDNTILYTDYIVSGVINTVKKFPKLEAGVFYVSDHGESLGENNMYLHGFPYKIAPKEQTKVPMIMWMNENMKKFDHIDYACLKENAQKGIYTHDNIFHSMIGLLEIKSKTYKKEEDMFSICRTKELPGY